MLVMFTFKKIKIYSLLIFFVLLGLGACSNGNKLLLVDSDYYSYNQLQATVSQLEHNNFKIVAVVYDTDTLKRFEEQLASDSALIAKLQSKKLYLLVLYNSIYNLTDKFLYEKELNGIYNALNKHKVARNVHISSALVQGAQPLILLCYSY